MGKPQARKKLTPAGKRNLKKRQQIINKNLVLLKKLKANALKKKAIQKTPLKKLIPSIESDYKRLRDLGVPVKEIEKIGNEDYIDSMIRLDEEIQAQKRRKPKKK